jgi:cellulose synthase/poly-beta-1,6-N-acetylglucosamine synthase-like glycosyltransferase
LIYSDEGEITEKNERKDPSFKPDWAPDTFRSYNYIRHFTVIRKKLLDEIGGFRQGFDGTQDYDLFLRVTDCTKRIAHIPRVLYHWRTIEGLTAKKADAKPQLFEISRRALQDHLRRDQLVGDAEKGPSAGVYHVKYALRDKPAITIIISIKDKARVLKRCIDSIRTKSSYENCSIMIIDSGSKEEDTLEYLQNLQSQEGITILNYDKPFNYSAIHNFAFQQLRTEFAILMNNDTEITSPDWIEPMLEFAQWRDVGVVDMIL